MVHGRCDEVIDSLMWYLPSRRTPPHPLVIARLSVTTHDACLGRLDMVQNLKYHLQRVSMQNAREVVRCHLQYCAHRTPSISRLNGLFALENSQCRFRRGSVV
jgi:hypothetical protein